MEEDKNGDLAVSSVASPHKQRDKQKMLETVNTAKESKLIDNIAPKSRTIKSKRFNSTNVKYRKVISKAEKKTEDTNPLRKWSQFGHISSNLMNQNKEKTLRVRTAGK